MAARKPPPPQPEQQLVRKRFTNQHPLIFPDLHAGSTPVEYADDSNAPSTDEPGALLVLHAGDIVTVPADYVHAWLTAEETK
jgi:hypothetical protein